MSTHLVVELAVGAGVVAGTLLACWHTQRAPRPRSDRAAHYKDAMHAAIRLQRAAHDAERAIVAERIRYSGLTEPEDS